MLFPLLGSNQLIHWQGHPPQEQQVVTQAEVPGWESVTVRTELPTLHSRLLSGLISVNSSLQSFGRLLLVVETTKYKQMWAVCCLYFSQVHCIIVFFNLTPVWSGGEIEEEVKL